MVVGQDCREMARRRQRPSLSQLLPPAIMPASMTCTSMVGTSSLIARLRAGAGRGWRTGRQAASPAQSQGRGIAGNSSNRTLIHSPSEAGEVKAGASLVFSLEIVDFFAGMCGGCMGVLVGHPFDTIKVRVQSVSQGSHVTASGAFQSLMKQEGISGLLKGIEAPLIGNIPVQGIVFGAYGACLRRIIDTYGGENERGEAPMWQVYAAGSMAGLAQAAPVTAAEYCKTQMQLQVESREQAQHNYLGRTHGASGRMLFKSSVDCFMYNVKTHGMASVFRGLTITVVRDLNYGQWFAQYEWTKRWFLSQHDEGDSPLFPIYSAAAGAMAGATGWVIIFPIDTMKTRLQTRQATEPTYRIMDCARDMWKESPRGRAFTRGLGVCLVRSIPVNAVTFLTYEAVMALGQRLHESC